MRFASRGDARPERNGSQRGRAVETWIYNEYVDANATATADPYGYGRLRTDITAAGWRFSRITMAASPSSADPFYDPFFYPIFTKRAYPKS